MRRRRNTKTEQSGGGKEAKDGKVLQTTGKKKTLPCFLAVRPLAFFMLFSFSVPLIRTTHRQVVIQALREFGPTKKGEDKKNPKNHLFLMAASKTITAVFEKLPEGGSTFQCQRGEWWGCTVRLLPLPPFFFSSQPSTWFLYLEY